MEQYRKLSKLLKPNAQSIICGCAVKSNAQIVDQYFQGDTFGPREKRILNDLVDATTPIENFEYPFLVGDGRGRYLKELNFFEKFISDTIRIKVNEGCLNNCTFCGIKDAIGHLKSTPMENIQEQLNDGLNKDYKKVCLISEDVAAWGMDLKSNVSSLVQGVLDTDRDFDLGLFDMNPRWLIKYWDDLKHQLLDPRVKEILIPIQSGSDRILELMKRHHEAYPVAQIVKWLKTHAPNVKIGASVIVGFPSETDADFEQTRVLLENFDYASVSWFSPISGKKAAFMNEIIENELMDQRAKACSEVTECRIFT